MRYNMTKEEQYLIIGIEDGWIEVNVEIWENI